MTERALSGGSPTRGSSSSTMCWNNNKRINSKNFVKNLVLLNIINAQTMPVRKQYRTVNLLTSPEHHISRPSPGGEFCSCRRVHILLQIKTGLSFSYKIKPFLSTWNLVDRPYNVSQTLKTIKIDRAVLSQLLMGLSLWFQIGKDWVRNLIVYI